MTTHRRPRRPSLVRGGLSAIRPAMRRTSLPARPAADQAPPDPDTPAADPGAPAAPAASSPGRVRFLHRGAVVGEFDADTNRLRLTHGLWHRDALSSSAVSVYASLCALGGVPATAQQLGPRALGALAELERADLVRPHGAPGPARLYLPVTA